MLQEKEELLEAIAVMELLTKENPCRAKQSMFSTITSFIKMMISKEYAKGLSQDRVAEALGISARTLQRWREKYEDFPKPRHDGFKSVSYDMYDIARWKMLHVDLFESLGSE